MDRNGKSQIDENKGGRTRSDLSAQSGLGERATPPNLVHSNRHI